ncbi:YbfB/YjiJ family MFS transporter [Rhodoferax saidenbachensis]|uniref:MFS family permease n=1 Tax=Rhodoferax saidenbachensis TaxID=1484693 RepID=A0ABU1ZND1_9BURK|nr:YbfB/YjiJ family MFS transporter [Rhodoferax saidenbachensis]MDR7307056.1 MFS family permease [Rhodoferax saidenbachensis]
MRSPKPIAIALAGLVSLAVAMGIGRFAFTPLLPMMLHDGVIDLHGASWLATANYIGYWLGAMACALQPWAWSRWPALRPVVHTKAMRWGLALTVLLTLGMALHWPLAWPLWRLLAGIASALVFVYTSGWCLARLAALGAPQLAGVIYVGPGLGIAVSGLAATAMVATGLSAATGWMAMAALALVLTTVLWPQLQGVVPTVAPPTVASDASGNSAMTVLALAYGLAGFGYIVTATFLPVIARQALPDSIWLDLFWPLFGVGVGLGALLTIRLPTHWDRRHLLMACYALQASGILLGVWWPSLVGFALGSLLIGLPFTAITLFAMQEVRRLRPHGASAFIGLLTAVYGLGQIAGPPWVALLLAHSSTTAQGFALSLETAAASLVMGIALYYWLARRYP